MEREVMVILEELFTKYNLKINSFHIRFTNRGQIEYCAGTMEGNLDEQQTNSIEKEFRKRLSSDNYRFLNTELSVTTKKFSITKK